MVPARSGSKSIIDKNMQLVGGYSLIARAVKSGLDAGNSNTYITTNSMQYGQEARSYGAKFEFLRPDHFSQDESTDNDYLKHFVEWCQNNNLSFEYLVILRPTSPFRDIKIIKKH